MTTVPDVKKYVLITSFRYHGYHGDKQATFLGGIHKNIGNKNSFNIEVLSHFLIHFYYLLISLNIISPAINDFFSIIVKITTMHSFTKDYH
jgi:hypothetical protein